MIVFAPVKGFTWIGKLLCLRGFHAGPVVAHGRVQVTAKKNKKQKPIPGIWKIHRCKRPFCGMIYAGPNDLIHGKTEI